MRPDRPGHKRGGRCGQNYRLITFVFTTFLVAVLLLPLYVISVRTLQFHQRYDHLPPQERAELGAAEARLMVVHSVDYYPFSEILFVTTACLVAWTLILVTRRWQRHWAICALSAGLGVAVAVTLHYWLWRGQFNYWRGSFIPYQTHWPDLLSAPSYYVGWPRFREYGTHPFRSAMTYYACTALALTATTYVASIVVRWWRKKNRFICDCGYDLCGSLHSEVCPECGRPHDLTLEKQGNPMKCKEVWPSIAAIGFLYLIGTELHALEPRFRCVTAVGRRLSLAFDFDNPRTRDTRTGGLRLTGLSVTTTHWMKPYG